MSEPENTLPDSSELSELKQECTDLRRQLNLTFMAITVISLTFSALLFLQSRRTAKDLEIVVPQEAQVREANKKEKPALDAILNRFYAYSQNHPEFAAILNKYPLVKQGATNAVTPSSALPERPLPTTPPVICAICFGSREGANTAQNSRASFFQRLGDCPIF